MGVTWEVELLHMARRPTWLIKAFSFFVAWNAQSNKLMFSEDTCPSQHNRSMFHQFQQLDRCRIFFSFQIVLIKKFLWAKSEKKSSP